MIVIDDVTTTGATLEEARRALRKKTNAQIIGLAFAH
jgi:predicted amidophosphoribosyltransferase